MRASADRWIRRATTSSVVGLAVIAAVVSYGHMRSLALANGQGTFTATLTPLSVDGMIVASSMSLLLDSRAGRRGGRLPWALLAIGSVASLAANVAVAPPTACGRLIAAWPSFALIGAYELLMRQIRHRASCIPVVYQSDYSAGDCKAPAVAVAGALNGPAEANSKGRTKEEKSVGVRERPSSRDIRSPQYRAWHWALEHAGADGTLPTGKMIAAAFNRHERWGRLVKHNGQCGGYDPT